MSKYNFSEPLGLEPIVRAIVGYVPYELEQFSTDIVDKALEQYNNDFEISYVYELCCRYAADRLKNDIVRQYSNFSLENIEYFGEWTWDDFLDDLNPWMEKIVNDFVNKLSDNFFDDYFSIYTNGSLDSHFYLRKDIDNEDLIALAIIKRSSDIFDDFDDICNCDISIIENYSLWDSNIVIDGLNKTYREFKEIIDAEVTWNPAKLLDKFPLDVSTDRDITTVWYKNFMFYLNGNYEVIPMAEIFDFEGGNGKVFVSVDNEFFQPQWQEGYSAEKTVWYVLKRIEEMTIRKSCSLVEINTLFFDRCGYYIMVSLDCAKDTLNNFDQITVEFREESQEVYTQCLYDTDAKDGFSYQNVYDLIDKVVNYGEKWIVKGGYKTYVR